MNPEPLDVRVLEEAGEDEQEEQRENRSEEDGCRISPEDFLVEPELMQDQGDPAHSATFPVPSACRVSSR